MHFVLKNFKMIYNMTISEKVYDQSLKIRLFKKKPSTVDNFVDSNGIFMAIYKRLQIFPKNAQAFVP